MQIKWLYEAIAIFKKMEGVFYGDVFSPQKLQGLPAAVVAGAHTIGVFLLFQFLKIFYFFYVSVCRYLFLI